MHARNARSDGQQQDQSSGVDPRALDPNACYAVAPSPFFVSPAARPPLGSNPDDARKAEDPKKAEDARGDDASSPGVAPPGSRADDDAMITLSVTADTQVPARRLSLPLWFATEFLKFRGTTSLSVSLSSDTPRDTVFVHRPRADIEVIQRAIIAPSKIIAGMTVTGGLSPKGPAVESLPVTSGGIPIADVVGTAEERAAFASASAALIFKTLSTVPHCVVPSLVLEFVVAPYVAKVHCTMAEGMLGVTEVTQTSLAPSAAAMDLAAVPNLTKLMIDDTFEGAVPPSITTLVLKTTRIPALQPTHQLTSLSLTVDPKLDHLEALAALRVPVRSLRRLTMRGLAVVPESDDLCRRRLESLGQLFPTVESLSLLSSHSSPAITKAFEDKSWWPDLCELDAAASQVVTIASARPHGWRRVTCRCTRHDNLCHRDLLVDGEVHFPHVLHLSLDSSVLPEMRMVAPSLRTLYMAGELDLDWNGNRAKVLTAPKLQHVLTDACLFDNDDSPLGSVIAASCGSAVRFVSFRSGDVWGLSPEGTWVTGAVVPRHLDLSGVCMPDLSAPDPHYVPVRPRRSCQCLLVT